MKKKTYFLINFIIIFLLVILKESYAYTTGTVYLSSSKDIIEKDQELEITISIANAKTAAFTSYLYFDDTKLEYVSGPENTNIIGNRIIYVWYDETGGNGAKEGELTKFKFKAKEDGLATFSIEGEFYNNTGQLIQTDVKEIQLQIGREQTKLEKQTKEEQGANSQSSNATLQSLRVNIEGTTPNFEKDINEYYLTVSSKVNDIEVLAVSENPNATIEITGNTNLKKGLNLITIKVTSEDKTQNNSYTIYVTKTDNEELANSNLEILAVENTLLNPPFETSITHYMVEVSNETTSLNVLAVPENEKGTVQITGKNNLKEGNNLITIAVTAPNGISKRIYQINVYKRNQEEENKYKEQQQENKEKLEEIYQAERISTPSEEGLEKSENKKENRRIWLVLVAVIIGVSLIIILATWKYKKRKKS